MVGEVGVPMGVLEKGEGTKNKPELEPDGI